MIYFSSIYELTGAGKIARTFKDQASLFCEYGVDNISIFSLENENKNNTNKSHCLKNKVKKIIKALLEKSYFGNCLFIKGTYFKNGARAVEQYFQSSKQDEDLLLFHDIYSCYAYLNYCRSKQIIAKKYLLAEHTNGDLWKMLRLYFPKIVGSTFYNQLIKISDLCEEKASYICLVSNSSRKKFLEQHPNLEDKTLVIYNGIEEYKYRQREKTSGTLDLITVGTVNERKNQIMLIRALNKIDDDRIKLTVVGDGPELENCRNLVRDLNLEANVNLLGAKTNVAELLSKADVFVMCSLDEGLPVACIEALRAGLPVICSDVGGCKELICDNGILIEPTLDQICDAIVYMLNNPEKTNSMSLASLKLYENKFSIDAMVEGYSEIFKKINNASSERV